MAMRSARQLSNAADVCSGAYCGGENAEEAEGGGVEVRLVVQKVGRAVVPVPRHGRGGGLVITLKGSVRLHVHRYTGGG